mgnify:CR=1 FL=1
MDITGRKLFVKALEEEGVDTIFGYPGGTVTDLFDELYKTDSINLILPRHEQGLIHEAHRRIKGGIRIERKNNMKIARAVPSRAMG